MEEVAGGSRGEAVAGCGQAAGPLELCSLRSSKNYMSCFHSIVNGYASLPEDEAQKAQAQSAKQVFKDFVFSF